MNGEQTVENLTDALRKRREQVHQRNQQIRHLKFVIRELVGAAEPVLEDVESLARSSYSVPGRESEWRKEYVAEAGQIAEEHLSRMDRLRAAIAAAQAAHKTPDEGGGLERGPRGAAPVAHRGGDSREIRP